jgi:hypothetical protein
MTDTVLAICAGVGLAAACGLRVFAPLLAAGIAARAGYLDPPGTGFDWIGSGPALTVLAVATLAEIGAYFVPWLDHALDTVASPAAVVAGTLSAAFFLPEMHPAISWSAAIVAGGGTAGIVQTGSVLTRAVSGATTAGLGNPLVAAIESAGAVVMSILAIVLPVLAALCVLVILAIVVRQIIRYRRWRRGRREGADAMAGARV